MNDKITLTLTEDQFQMVKLALDSEIEFIEKEVKSKGFIEDWKNLRSDILQQANNGYSVNM